MTNSHILKLKEMDCENIIYILTLKLTEVLGYSQELKRKDFLSNFTK
jgi:hypothetical protein